MKLPFLELFFGLSLSTSRNPFHETTCATELRIFRRLFRFWVASFATLRRSGLAEVGVVALDSVVFPWPLGEERQL